MSHIEGQTRGWKARAQSLNCSPSPELWFTHSFNKFLCPYYEPFTVLGAGDTAIKPQNGCLHGACVHDSMQVSSTACIMINHFNLCHFTLSCLICVKLFCLYIPLSSWNVLLLYCPQHHPALGLASIQCINIINLNTKEHRSDRTKRESNHPRFSWMAMTLTYGSCVFLCKQELAMWPTILAQIPTYSQVSLPTF